MLPHSPHNDTTEDPPEGRIDIHCHLLPSIDDGCLDYNESFECVDRLVAAGFIGSICTPHFYPEQRGCPTIDHVRNLTAQLEQAIHEHGATYRVWPGGELRIYDGIIDWLKDNQPPTLANSKCVLVDFWVHKWAPWINAVFEWLLAQGYQPIFAHPERLACTNVLDKQLTKLTQMGVWLQGNFRCMTGEDGYEPDIWVRRLIAEDRYRFMALDAHRPNSLESRLDGMQLVDMEFGQEKLDRFTIDAPRKYILANRSQAI